MLNRLLNNKFIQGGFIFTSASFVVSVLNYFFNLLLARGFSLSIYGEYMSALSYFAILTVPFSALNIIVIKRISKSKVADRASVAKSIENLLINNIIKYKFQILVALVAIFAIFYLKTNLTLATILFIILSSILNMFSILYSATIQAYKSFLIAGLFALSMAVLKIIGGLTVIRISPGLLTLYILLISLNLLSIFIGSKLLSYKQVIKNRTISVDSISKYLLRKQILLPTITMLGVIGMLNMDLIMVKKFFDAQEVGLYAALSLLGKIILYGTGPLSLVAMTFFSGSENKHNKEKILFFTAGVYLFVGIIATFFYYNFSELVVSLIFGMKFIAISQYIWLSAIFGSLYSIVTLFAQYSIAESRNFSTISLAGLIFQILGFYFFNNSFYDILMVNIVAMIVMTIIYSIFILRHAKTKA